MAKRGRPRHQQVKKAIVRTAEADESPAVWISQLKEGINYGVRDPGRPGKRTTLRAIAEFLRVKHFVEVELPAIESGYVEEKLKLSEQALHAKAAATTKENG